MSRVLGCALVGWSSLVLLASQSLGQEVLPRPNEAEARIEAALKQPTKLEFVDQPMSDVVEFLQEHHKIPIQLDYRALVDEGIGSDTPIMAHLDGISLRSALRLVLGQLDLTYVVRNEVLMLTTRTEAENMLVLKMYPVRDLVSAESEFRPPSARREAQTRDFDSLIELITATIAPTTWDEVGGPGSITEFAHSQALAFSQTAEVHEEIAELLAALRRTRDKQLAAAKALPQAAQEAPEVEVESMQVKVYRLRPGAAMHGRGMGRGFFAVPDKTTSGEANGKPAPQQVMPAKPAPVQSPPAQNGNRAKTARPVPAVQSGPDPKQLAKWAEEIAVLLPEVVAPESWKPGEGFVRAAAGSLVIRQSEAVHRQVAELLNELLPGYAAAPATRGGASVRLAVPGPQIDWPQEAEPRPNAKEVAIEKALDSKLDLVFVDAPLAEVIEYIERQSHIPVLLDARALSDEGIGSDTPITRNLKGISLRAGLRLTLGELDLTYLVRDEVLLITTKTEAENMLTCKVYPVFDLVVRPADAPHSEPAVDFASLIQAVTSNIAPTTWDGVGGPGAIQEFANAGALVVSQTTEIHEEIAGYLRALREVSAEQK